MSDDLRGVLLDIHNRSAGAIVRSIVEPTLAAGGRMTDCLVVLESVLLGFMLMHVKLGGDDAVLDALVAGVKARLAQLRLGGLAPEGRA